MPVSNNTIGVLSYRLVRCLEELEPESPKEASHCAGVGTCFNEFEDINTRAVRVSPLISLEITTMV